MKYTLETGEYIVPDGITELTIPKQCSARITIPESVVVLNDFRKYVDTSIPLPSSITHLTLDTVEYSLKQGYFPRFLTHLTINNLKKRFKKDVIPSSLKYLKIYFMPMIRPGTLPDNLEILKFPYRYGYCVFPGTIPRNLKKLSFSGQFYLIDENVLPDSIEVIHINEGYFDVSRNAGPIQETYKITLPKSLKEFVFEDDEDNNNRISYIFPENMKKIFIDCEFSPVKKGILPENLETLTFGDLYDIPIKKGVLPKGLKNLNFGNRYDREIEENVLPDSLEVITFGRSYNKPFGQGVLPEGLNVIIFGDEYNQPIGLNVLPSTLKHIVFGKYFTKTLMIKNKKVLPEGVENIDIYNDKYIIYHRTFNLNMNIRIVSKKTGSMINITDDIHRLLLIDELLPSCVADPILFYLKHIQHDNDKHIPHDNNDSYTDPHTLQCNKPKKRNKKGFKIYSFEPPQNISERYKYGKIYNPNSNEDYENGERYIYYANDEEKIKTNTTKSLYFFEGWTIVPAARRESPL